MKVKLNQDQRYIAENGGIRFGKKGETVAIDALFYKLISDVCTPVKSEEKEEEKEEKPLDKMNKSELREKAAEVGVNMTDEEFDAYTKADIIRLIQENLK